MESNVTVNSNYNLHEEVKKRIETETPSIREAIVAEIANKEILKRKSAVEKVLSDLDAVKAEIKNIKPTELFNKDGEVVSSTYTKEQLNKLNQFEERLKKIETALSEAFNNHDYTKIFKLQ